MQHNPYSGPCARTRKAILSPRYGGVKDLEPRRSVSADGRVIRSEKIGS